MPFSLATALKRAESGAVRTSRLTGREAEPTLGQIGIERIAKAIPINPGNLLYFINVERIHMMDRRHEVASVNHDPL